MHTADWTILILYLIGTVGIGVMLGGKVKNTSDLFAAGRASPPPFPRPPVWPPALSTASTPKANS
jgi:Na+/proline symporter